MNFDKWFCLERANKLIDQDTDETLRYACLELRYCIEAIAYETLLTHEKRIPQETLEMWQPKKVLEMLIEYDQDIENDYVVEFWTEDREGNPDKQEFIGKHHSITLKYIKRHYNKLGYYLHAPTPAHQKAKKYTPKDKLRTYLQNVAEDVQKFVSNSFHVVFQQTITFTCQECNETIIRNINSLRKERFITCFNPQCNAQYEWNGEKDGIKTPEFQLRQVYFNCPECDTRNYIPHHKLEKGKIVNCAKCQSKLLLNRGWIVMVKDSENTG